MASGMLFMAAEKLAALLQRADPNLSTVHDNTKRMEIELRRVHDLLEEDPGLEMNNKALRKWVRDLTDIAQDTEDVVDNFLCSLERRRQRRTGCMDCTFLLTLNDLLSRRNFVGEIKRMEKKMDPSVSSMMPNKQVFQFDKGFNELVEWLVDGDHPSRRLMCVVGSWGAGKTTLAKKVYNSTAVENRFPCRFWVHGETRLSYKMTIHEINLLQKITSKVTRCSQEELKDMDNIAMCKKISDTLTGKRYLIVLDINLTETWNSTRSAIMEAFPDENNGSRIVLTSKEFEYALQLGRQVGVRKLGFLTLEDRWRLFLKTFDDRAAADEASESSSSKILSKLEKIVKENGLLPAHIVNLGALLWMEYCRRGGALSNVLDDRLHYYRAEEKDGSRLDRIASDFDRLEHRLKLCFLYCSLFPRGFEIHKNRLVRLWLAQGWIPNGDKATANEYLEELARIGMIQVQERGRRKTFCLESLAWDFAAMRAVQCKARHLALDSSGIYNHLSQKNPLFNIRSLLCFPHLTVIWGKVTFPTASFKFLKALDLEDMYFVTQLPEEIGGLICLRYLGLRRCTALDGLPSSIGNLINLLSLDIRGTRVRPIPIAIQKLTQLQFLYMDMDDGSTSTDGGSLDLSSSYNLRVLSVIRVGPWMKNGLVKLTNLRKLGIYGDLYLHEYSEEVYNWPPLNTLRLGFGFGNTVPHMEDIFTFCRLSIKSLHLERPLGKLPAPNIFPIYLAKLCLKWSFLDQDPMPTLEQLKYLEKLKLGCGSFLGKKMVCSANGFVCLRLLELNLLDELEVWIVENMAMPRLERLVISLCNRLEMLPEGLQHLPRLKELVVAGMPEPFNARLRDKNGKDMISVTIDGDEMGATPVATSLETDETGINDERAADVEHECEENKGEIHEL